MCEIQVCFFVLGVCWFFLFHRETRRHGGRKGREREESLSLSFSFSSPSPALFLLREPPHFFCMFLFYRSRMTDRQKVSFFFETWMSDRRVAGSTLPKWFGFCVRRCGAKRIQKRRGCFVRHKASFFCSLAQEGEKTSFFLQERKNLFPFFFGAHTHTHNVGWVNVRAQHVVRRRAARETFAFFLVTAMQFLVGVPSLFAFAGVLVGIWLLFANNTMHNTPHRGIACF